MEVSPMNNVDFYQCYDYNSQWFLVEMVLQVPSSKIAWGGFAVPQEGVRKSDWQCPYMEQYLNADGTEKLCEAYEEPEEPVNPSRVAFFLYKVAADRLHTPYGDFPLTNAGELPARLQEIIEFE